VAGDSGTFVIAFAQPFEPINLRGSFVISINLSLLMQHKIIYVKVLLLRVFACFFFYEYALKHNVSVGNKLRNKSA